MYSLFYSRRNATSRCRSLTSLLTSFLNKVLYYPSTLRVALWRAVLFNLFYTFFLNDSNFICSLNDPAFTGVLIGLIVLTLPRDDALKDRCPYLLIGERNEVLVNYGFK